MKTIKRSLAAIAISAAALAGCQEIQIENDYTPKKYYASMEEFQPDTKTYLGEGNQILWSEGDFIEVFDGGEYGYYEVSESSVGKSSAEFVKIPEYGGPTVKCDRLFALYSGNFTLEDQYTIPKTDMGELIIPISISSWGSLYHSSILNNLPMVAVSPIGSQELSFKNVGGVIKLSIKGNTKITSIIIEGNSEEHIAGYAYVTVDEDGIHQISPSEDAGYYEQSIQYEDSYYPIMLSEEEATDFYIPIIPTDFKNGFTVTITDAVGNEYIKTTNKRNEVKRSHILTMPEFSIERPQLPPSSGQWIDLGLSVKWAAWNLGAESPEEYGDKYAWGETKPRSGSSLSNLIEHYEHKVKVYSEEDPDGWHWEFKFIGNNICGTQYDAAHVQWGQGARMPNNSEIRELCRECEFDYGTYKETEGFFVTGPNGKVIFLPASYRGDFYNDGTSFAQFDSELWGGELHIHEQQIDFASVLWCSVAYDGVNFKNKVHDVGVHGPICDLLHIRAVKD